MSLYYLPPTWAEFVGNAKAKAHFQNLARTIRIKNLPVNLSTMLLGPSRSGKTALVRHFARCILCERPDPETLNPCLECEPCNNSSFIEGNDDIASRISGVDYYFSPIDSNAMKNKPGRLEVRLGELKSADSIVRVAHFEEVSDLGANELQEALKVPMDDRGFLWIATGTTVAGLHEQFLNRFQVKLMTDLPEKDELALWLTRRCVERGIDCESLAVMRRLAERSNFRPGIALHVVEYASIQSPSAITSQLVESYVFDFNN